MDVEHRLDLLLQIDPDGDVVSGTAAAAATVVAVAIVAATLHNPY